MGRLHKGVAAFFLVLWPAGMSAISDSYVPLFVIERNINKNVVHYDAHVAPEGRLDPHQPVVAYWVMAAENGRKQELSIIERTRAYGFTTEMAGAGDSYYMRIVSERARPILVGRNGNSVRAEMKIAGRRSILRRIYITAHHSMMIPIADSAELYGDDIETGEPRYEKVAPGE